jgi:hypothetical protein
MSPAVTVLAAVVLGALVVSTLLGLERATRPVRFVEDRPLNPDVAAERVIDLLSRGSTRTSAALDCGGGIVVSVRWVVDLQLPRFGWWRVDVGEHTGVASDLSVVYAIVQGRLSAIERERGAS